MNEWSSDSLLNKFQLTRYSGSQTFSARGTLEKLQNARGTLTSVYSLYTIAGVTSGSWVSMPHVCTWAHSLNENAAAVVGRWQRCVDSTWPESRPGLLASSRDNNTTLTGAVWQTNRMKCRHLFLTWQWPYQRQCHNWFHSHIMWLTYAYLSAMQAVKALLSFMQFFSKIPKRFTAHSLGITNMMVLYGYWMVHNLLLSIWIPVSLCELRLWCFEGRCMSWNVEESFEISRRLLRIYRVAPQTWFLQIV